MITEVVAPVVHLNGTSKQTLMDELEGAYDALQEAYQALKLTAPNQRDYYVGNAPRCSTNGTEFVQTLPPIKDADEAYELACRQHASRQRALDGVIGSIQAQMRLVDTQGD